MSSFLFVVLSLFAVGGGVGLITFQRPTNSALSFIVTIISLAGLFALLNASFLFMVQLIVYAGAVITLLLFIIMFLNIQDKHLIKEKNRVGVVIVGIILLIPFNLVVLKAIGTIRAKPLEILQNDFGSIKLVGERLFEGWVLPFELVSILLLVALVGAIALATKATKW